MLEGSMSGVVDLHDEHSKPYTQLLFCVHQEKQEMEIVGNNMIFP